MSYPMAKPCIGVTLVLSLLCLALDILPSSTRIQNILCSDTVFDVAAQRAGASNASSSSSWAVPHYDFPSVEERFRYYMGSWYNMTDWTTDCSIVTEGGTTRDQFFNKDLVFQLDTLKSCSKRNDDKGILRYCESAYDTLRHGTGTDGIDAEEGDIAAIFNLGDRTLVQHPKLLPVITKARRADTSSNRQIIWLLNTYRHYNDLEQYHASKHAGREEMPWEDKLSTIVWRGKPTGSPHPSDSERTRVQLIKRWIHYNPDIVDVAFTGIVPQINGYQSEYMEKHSIREPMKIETMTKYKYLLSIEGNDVATGLKWMLYSNSVVMMAPPTKASWAMEDLLLPFVHYIPLSNDMSNLIEMYNWAEEHQEACKEISARATEFIERLWLSEQARIDNEKLKEKLATTYVKQFHKPLARCRAMEDSK